MRLVGQPAKPGFLKRKNRYDVVLDSGTIGIPLHPETETTISTTLGAIWMRYAAGLINQNRQGVLQTWTAIHHNPAITFTTNDHRTNTLQYPDRRHPVMRMAGQAIHMTVTQFTRLHVPPKNPHLCPNIALIQLPHDPTRSRSTQNTIHRYLQNPNRPQICRPRRKRKNGIPFGQPHTLRMALQYVPSSFLPTYVTNSFALRNPTPGEAWRCAGYCVEHPLITRYSSAV